jgi:DNA-directed RNA polymerase specialized sigma24 family protein
MKWMRFEYSFISRLRKKEEEAFTILYQKTCRQLYDYIIKRVDYDGETAEEMLIDVFSDAVTYAFSLTPLHNVEAWLFRIAKSKLADHFHRAARVKKWRIGTQIHILPD